MDGILSSPGTLLPPSMPGLRVLEPHHLQPHLKLHFIDCFRHACPPSLQGMFEPAMPDWSLEGSAKPGTALMLPLPGAAEAGGLDSQKAAIAQLREQVQCDLQYLYCHIIR